MALKKKWPQPQAPAVAVALLLSLIAHRPLAQPADRFDAAAGRFARCLSAAAVELASATPPDYGPPWTAVDGAAPADPAADAVQRVEAGCSATAQDLAEAAATLPAPARDEALARARQSAREQARGVYLAERLLGDFGLLRP